MADEKINFTNLAIDGFRFKVMRPSVAYLKIEVRVRWFLEQAAPQQYSTSELMHILLDGHQQPKTAKTWLANKLKHVAKNNPDLAERGPAEIRMLHGKEVACRPWLWQFKPEKKGLSDGE